MPYTQYRKTSDTDAGPSPAIWSQLKTQNMIEDPSVGIHFYDDFTRFRDVAAAETEAVGQANWGTFVKTGCTIAAINEFTGSAIRLTHDGTANDEINMAASNNVGTMGVLTLADHKKSAFEARFRTNDITNDQAYFIGVAEAAMAAEDALIADGCAALNDKDYLGFRVVDDANAALDIVFRNNGGGGEVEALAAAQTMVANTWYKVGWFWDGYRIFWYIDGDLQVITDVEQMTAATLATFPNGEYYTPTICTKQGGTAINYDLGFVRYAQEL